MAISYRSIWRQLGDVPTFSSADGVQNLACMLLADAGLPQQRSRSAGPERPSSTPRFDPTEYVRQRRDQQRAAADRLDEIRRQQRLPQLSSRPGSRPASLPSSRPSSLPGSSKLTPIAGSSHTWQGSYYFPEHLHFWHHALCVLILIFLGDSTH